MIKHVILWKLKDEVADKGAVMDGIKAGLEGLKGVVPGHVKIDPRCGSDRGASRSVVDLPGIPRAKRAA